MKYGVDGMVTLFENTARAMGDAELFIKQRHTRNCYKADSIQNGSC